MGWVAKYVHDPNARLDYPMDWAATVDNDGNTIVPYLQDGDSIIVSTMTVTTETFAETTELTVDDSSLTGAVQVAWVQGVDAAPGRYLLTFYIETADGITDERSVLLIVKHR